MIATNKIMFTLNVSRNVDHLPILRLFLFHDQPTTL